MINSNLNYYVSLNASVSAGLQSRSIKVTEEHRNWMHSIRNRYLQEVREFIQSFGRDGTSPGGRSFELIDSIVSLEENYSMLRILLGMKEGMIPLPQDIQILLSERRKALSEYLRRIQSGEITIA